MDDLPSYTAEKLESFSADELVALLVTDEDRVPRNVIEECARRGEPMLDRLQEIFDSGRGADEDSPFGDWWLQVHAMMILGLMTDARAGHLLLQFMSRATAGHDELNDWLNDPWPRLFENKPPAVIDAARTIATDRRRDWYERSSAQQAVLGAAVKSGTVDRELEWIAKIASDDSEDWTLRMLSASHLLDFPREPYRALLLDLAGRQNDESPPMFRGPDVERDYAGGRDRPEWKSRGSPWRLYHPEEIEARQEHWAELEESEARELIEPYVRGTPKIGRNDPCPCGSGKKYKRCCMPQG